MKSILISLLCGCLLCTAHAQYHLYKTQFTCPTPDDAALNAKVKLNNTLDALVAGGKLFNYDVEYAKGKPRKLTYYLAAQNDDQHKKIVEAWMTKFKKENSAEYEAIQKQWYPDRYVVGQPVLRLPGYQESQFHGGGRERRR